MANYLGNARCVNSGGLLGASRFWSLRADTANNTNTGDVTPWQYTAGTEVTLAYRTSTSGLAPPDEADTIILEVRRSDGSVLKQLHNGAPPANGTTFTVDLTDTGAAGGSDRCGCLELYVRAIRSGGLSPYDMNSQSNGDRGIIRSNAKVSDIAVNVYPAGSTFAYGVAGDETITLTATHTAPWIATEGQSRIDALDITATQASGSNQTYNGTTTLQSFTANNTFDDVSKSYGALFAPLSNSFITPSSGGILWTTFVDDGANVEQSGTNVRRQSFYSVDPRVYLSIDTLGQSLYNRGELATVDFSVTNARSEALTRSLNYQIKDSGGTTRKSASDAGANYDANYTIGNNDAAALDTIGSQWTLNLNQADVDTNPSANIYKVSRLRLLDLHPQLTGTLNKDDFPSEDANEQYSAVILGNIVYTWAHVENIRNDGTEVDTSGTALHLEIKDPDGGTQTTYDFDTGADGWSSRLNIQPNAPAGDWTYELSLTDQFNNTATASHTVTYITPLTSNLAVIQGNPVLVKSGQDYEMRIRCEVDNLADAPQTLPTWRLFDENMAEVTSGTMRNTVDDTATINGPIYRIMLSDMSVSTAGRYTVQYEAQLNGNGIKERDTFFVVDEVIDGSGFVGFPAKLNI